MELFRLFGTLVINTEQARRELDRIRNDANASGNDTAKSFEKIGKTAGTIGKAVVGAGTVLGGAWLAAIEGSRDYRQEMGLLDTAFVTTGHSSETAKKTYSDLNAVLGDSGQAVEASQHLAMLTDNEKDLQTWTDICTGVYAKFGESIPIESLTESANEVAKSGELTGGLVDALVWAGIGEEEFQEKLDACTTEQERQKLIMNTLNGTYKKASDQYKETNKDVMDARKAQEKLSDAFSELGRVGEPILTAIKTKVADMVTAAIPHIENFIQKVKDLKKWIKDNQTTIDTWVSVIAGATVSIGAFLLILNWGKIMGSATTAIKGVRAALLLFNAALKANPIGIVISLLAGLVTAFIYLWNNNEGFRNFWIGLWDKIKSTAGTATKWIKDKFNDLKDVVSNVKKRFDEIKTAISDKINGAKDAVKKAIDKIKGYFPLSIGKIFSNFKIPKITVSGGKAPYGIAGKGKLPSFDVKWNAEGGILTRPTIFGQTGNTLLGGGEAGHEAIAPIDVLQRYVTAAVKDENEGVRKTLVEQFQLLIDFLSRTMPHGVMLETGVLVGELTPAIDMRLSDRWNHAQRGNTR